MSEPKRYTDLQVWETLHFAGSTNGWVRWEDYKRIKAEVERLRKAGDAMVEELIGCYRAEGYDPADSETLPKWNAAKEGKPSV